jgi:hypothetical protein
VGGLFFLLSDLEMNRIIRLFVVLNRNGSYVALGTTRFQLGKPVHTSSWHRDKTEGGQVVREARSL